MSHTKSQNSNSFYIGSYNGHGLDYFISLMPKQQVSINVHPYRQINESLVNIRKKYNARMKLMTNIIGEKNTSIKPKVFENVLINFINDYQNNREKNKKIIIDKGLFLFDLTIKNNLKNKYIFIYYNPIYLSLNAWHKIQTFSKENNDKTLLELLKVNGDFDIDKYVMHSANKCIEFYKNKFRNIETYKRILLIDFEDLNHKFELTARRIYSYLNYSDSFKLSKKNLNPTFNDIENLSSLKKTTISEINNNLKDLSFLQK